MERFFKLKENDTNVRQEVVAGITTFMTMAYILIVNPTILSAAGMDSGTSHDLNDRNTLDCVNKSVMGNL